MSIESVRSIRVTIEMSGMTAPQTAQFNNNRGDECFFFHLKQIIAFTCTRPSNGYFLFHLKQIASAHIHSRGGLFAETSSIRPRYFQRRMLCVSIETNSIRPRPFQDRMLFLPIDLRSNSVDDGATNRFNIIQFNSLMSFDVQQAAMSGAHR